MKKGVQINGGGRLSGVYVSKVEIDLGEVF